MANTYDSESYAVRLEGSNPSLDTSWKSNRDKKRDPKMGKFWCWGCDAALIYEGQKCPNCGKKDMRKRNKK